LFLWASWCGPCIKPLQDLHDTLELNKNFLDKATFWSICLDDDVNEIADKISGSRWETYIKHFLLEDTDYEHELIKAF
jgi:thiol-disulfide isomerase/thioredoxin